MSNYAMSSYDVCVQGCERLRSPNEFIIIAPIRAETTLDELISDLKDDVQACMREDHFDYDECNRIVETLRLHLSLAFAQPNPFHLEPSPEDDEIDMSDNWPNFFLYVRDEEHTFPVL